MSRRSRLTKKEVRVMPVLDMDEADRIMAKIDQMIDHDAVWKWIHGRYFELLHAWMQV